MKKYIFIILTLSYFVCYGQERVKKTFVVDDYFIYDEIVKYGKTISIGVDTIIIQTDIDTLSFILNKEKYITRAVGYYNNGNKYTEFSFDINGIKGWTRKWHKNGKIWWEDFTDTIINSIYMEYYPTGALYTFSTHTKTNSGLSIIYYPSGKKKEVNLCVDTTERGFVSFGYSESGNLTTKTIFNIGAQEYIEYYDNGNVSKKGTICDMEFYLLGKWQEWYENGIMKREYFFDKEHPNIKEGTWSWWDKKGNLIEQKKFKKDKLIEEKSF